MSVRNAVAKREEAAAVEAAGPSPLQLVSQAVERQAEVLAAVLPQHMSRERFEQITLAAIKSSPDLVRCFGTVEGRTSVMAGVIQAASAGLEVNSIAKEAWLIPRRVSWPIRKDDSGQVLEWGERWEASLQLDYRGVEKLARRDPNVKQITSGVVRDGDEFEYWTGLEADHFHHRVVGPSTRELTHAYCIVRYHAGGAQVEVMDRDDVHKRRDVSQGYQTDLKKPPKKRTNPWFIWPARQWAKTAVHGMKNRLDLAPEVRQALDADDRVLTINPTGEIVGVDDGYDELPVGPVGIDEPPPSEELLDGGPPPDDPPVTATAPGGATVPASAAEFRKLVGRRTKAITTAVQKAFPDRAGELATIDGIRADPEALDHAMGLLGPKA